MTGPYGVAARAYVLAGWLGALPLPPGKKDPVPAGYTGKKYFDVDPDSNDVGRWINEQGNGNVAIRMPRDVLGIDVDAYGEKPGAASLAAAEAKWGPLPKTWTSSSRDDGTSGIRFYLVPEGLKWPNTVGPGIETVHRGHRYAVVWPSLHPETRRLYRWHNPDGLETNEIPRPSHLATLPEAWVTGLTSGEMATEYERAAPPVDAVHWLTDGDGMDVCTLIDDKAAEVWEILGNQGSRHDGVRDLVLAVLYYGQQGHKGAAWAMKSIGDAWLAELSPDRGTETATREWESFVAGAYSIIAAKPRPHEYCTGRGCKGTVFEGLPELGAITPPSELQRATLADFRAAPDFWDARPVLSHLRDFALARRASPWATLGCALVRATCAIGPAVVLPPFIGSEASLNLFIGIVGPSGSGKGAAEGAARDAVRMPALTEIGVGSGEGIVHSYVKFVPAKGGEPGHLDQHTTAVLFRAAEVDTLAALKSRQGSTLLPMLRDAWIGDQLSFAYASQEKRLVLFAHQYRMGLIVGIQPRRASVLLDDEDGGTPQRFLWLPSQDFNAPDKPPPVPEPWKWSQPDLSSLPRNLTTGRMRVPVCQAAADEVDAARLATLRGATDALDGHALLARLKTAVALAILESRLEVNDDDWALAGRVLAQSDATRLGTRGQLETAGRELTERRAINDARRQDKVAEELETSALSRVVKRVLAKVEDSGKDGITLGELRRKIAYRDRDYLEEAVDRILQTSLVTSEIIDSDPPSLRLFGGVR